MCFLREAGWEISRRFASVKSLVAFAGFDPSKRVSADKVTSHVPTAGSRFLRRAFLQAASGAMLAKFGLGTYGQTVRARHGKRGWFAGVNAVESRMRILVWIIDKIEGGSMFSDRAWNEE